MSQKKSILFANYSMPCGGVEKSMLSVLNFLSPEQYDITLLLTDVQGDLLPLVPPHVKVVEVPFAPMDRYELQHGRMTTLKYALTHFHWLHAFRMLSLRLRWRLSGARDNFNVRVIRAMMRRVDVAKMPTAFDYAFAYAGGSLIGSIVRDLIDAPIKAIWCHNENEIGLMTATGVWRDVHTHFTHRFATKQLCEKLNSVSERGLPPFEVMPYVLDGAFFQRMAIRGTGFPDDFNGLRILSVGRLSHQKGFDVAIGIAARLKAAGYNFRWYIVGGGEEHTKLRQLIVQKKVDDCFMLLGQFINPYSFFAQCDIYAQPSRWEAYCITVAEARAFNKPIVCTDFVGAREQLMDGRTGLITPLSDENLFYDALARLLRDRDLRNELSANLAEQSVTSNEMALRSWRQLLGNNGI